MPIHLLPQLLLYILVVGYSPGPANLYAMSCAMNFGRRRALRMWQGMVCGFTVDVVLMAVLTHLLDTQIGQYIIYIRYVGAAYILWLAIDMLRDAIRSVAAEDARLTQQEQRGARRASGRKPCSFWSGMLMQLTNAKMLVFELMMFSMFVLPYSDSLTDLLIVAALLHLSSPLATLSWLMAGIYLRRFFRRYHRWVDIVMGLLLVGCAAMILLG